MFEKDQFVSFGYRVSSFGRKGWGARSHIPRAFGRVVAVTDSGVVVQPEASYSDRAQTFTLRKSGNWVMAGKPDDHEGRMNLEVCQPGVHSLSSGSRLINYAKTQGVDLLPQIEAAMLKSVAELQNQLTEAKYDMDRDPDLREYVVKEISRNLKEVNNELLSVRSMIKETAL